MFVWLVPLGRSNPEASQGRETCTSYSVWDSSEAIQEVGNAKSNSNSRPGVCLSVRLSAGNKVLWYLCALKTAG